MNALYNAADLQSALSKVPEQRLELCKMLQAMMSLSLEGFRGVMKDMASLTSGESDALYFTALYKCDVEPSSYEEADKWLKNYTRDKRNLDDLIKSTAKKVKVCPLAYKEAVSTQLELGYPPAIALCICNNLNLPDELTPEQQEQVAKFNAMDDEEAMALFDAA